MTAAGWPAVVLLAAAGLGALGGLSATLRLVVTVATDDGDGVCDARCTLRDAIAAANAAPGRDTIVFAIGGGGPRVLRVTAPLPAVTSPVRLDATTQPGWAGRPIVALDGAAAGPATIGLDLAGAGTVVRGLAVHSFSRAGLRIRGERTVVAASAVGTDWRAEPLGNRSHGVLVLAPDVVVGGDGDDGNHIAHNGGAGILLGPTAERARVIGNAIAENRGDGISIASRHPHRLSRNSLARNAGLGIDRHPGGVDRRAAGARADGGGPPALPTITAASRSRGVGRVAGRLTGAPGSTVTVEVFASPACDPSGHGEAAAFAGAVEVAVGGGGRGTFVLESKAPALAIGWAATATATDAAGNTSELSACAEIRRGDDPAPAPAVGRPSFLLVLTDDQPFDALAERRPVMPRLQARVQDPADHWIRFTNAYLNTPQCCPSRATILTGQYAHHHTVVENRFAWRLDESSTLATWLDDAGYHTGMVGKYLNGWPHRRPPYVPPGWDQVAIFTGARYFDYDLYVGGDGLEPYGATAADYSTDVLLDKALRFLAEVPAGRPFFLYFTPNAPHRPFQPAPRHAGLWRTEPLRGSPALDEADVSDKPAWIRRIGPLAPERLARAAAWRRQQYAALAAVDEAVDALLAELEARGRLDDTVVVFLSDNGFGSGEHRLIGKGSPYRESAGTPLFVRYPGAVPRADGHVVANTDLAPTLAELAGVTPPLPVDGRSLVPLLEGGATAWADETLVQFVGVGSPEWWGVRTSRYAYNELSATGEVELYDLQLDPHELASRCTGAPPKCQPGYDGVRRELAARLAALRAR